MIESLRTTQIAFFRFATRCGFFRGRETRYKKYPCKGSCKRTSYETIPEKIVSRYQTLVSSLPRRPLFDTDDRKLNLLLGRTGSPVIRHSRNPKHSTIKEYISVHYNNQIWITCPYRRLPLTMKKEGEFLLFGSLSFSRLAQKSKDFWRKNGLQRRLLKLGV